MGQIVQKRYGGIMTAGSSLEEYEGYDVGQNVQERYGYIMTASSMY